jgi:hypothetical protein
MLTGKLKKGLRCAGAGIIEQSTGLPAVLPDDAAHRAKIREFSGYRNDFL